MTETSPLPRLDFPGAPDLSDPAVLIKMCDEIASGIDRQAEASLGGSLMAGHPSPAFFYGQTSQLLKACADFIKSKTTVEPVPAPTKVDPKLNKQPSATG